ncbi:MAG: glycosyltransferase [Gammaproteobacteria bacterium]|nr:glycosyltransferase [Gammaproteobacteria bacterium]
MNIMLMARSLNRGGAERQLVMLANTLADEGNEVHVVCWYGGGELELDLHPAIDLHTADKSGRYANVAFVKRLLNLVDGLQPDCLYSFMEVPNVIAALIGYLRPGLPLLWGIRSSNMDWSRYNWLAGLGFMASCAVVDRADGIIANSCSGAIHYRRLGFPADRIHVVANGIDTDRFRPRPAAGRRLRQCLGLAPDVPLILLPGRLDPMKGHSVFLRAAAMVATEYPAARYVILGADVTGMRPDLENLCAALGIADRVLCLHARARPEYWYAAADIVVSASLFGEGFPNVLAEAMACGTPCVATDAGDSAQVLGGYGEVVRVDDVGDLAAAIIRNLRSPMSEQRRVAMTATVAARFSLADLSRRTQSILLSLPATRRCGPADDAGWRIAWVMAKMGGRLLAYLIRRSCRWAIGWTRGITGVFQRLKRVVSRALPLPVRQHLRTLVDRFSHDAATSAQVHMAVAIDALRPPEFYVPGNLVVVNNALAWGGVERQVVNVLRGIATRPDFSVALLTLRLHAGEDYRFFEPQVAQIGIHYGDIVDIEKANDRLEMILAPVELQNVAGTIGFLPDDVQSEVYRFLAEFLWRRPRVVHAWQDAASIAAGFAAAIAGVPVIILSGRNVSPVNFAYYRPYMRAAYRILSKHPNVVLVNNSEAGAADYAGWLEIERGRFVVKRNGIDDSAICSVSTQARDQLRERLGIPAGVPVVGSIFRFYDEKRPRLWIATCIEIARRMPEVHFVVFGTGPLAPEMRQAAERAGIVGQLHLPGTEQNASLALSVMDAFLLTSRFEGTPNVLLEAQLLGIPVVTTAAGGAAEAVSDGCTGFVVIQETDKTLAERVITCLTDADFRSGARRQGPAFVRQRFGMSRMITDCLRLYGVDDGLHGVAPANRIAT